MCGLFTIVPSAIADPETMGSLFKNLAYLNHERGGHAWGLWGASQDPVRGLGDLHKEGYYQLSQVVKHWEVEEGNWLAGHTRFATHGSHAIAHAHPFQVQGPDGSMLLAHNGVVTVKNYEKSHPVDSGQIALAIAREGLVAGMANVIGSCALILSAGKAMCIYRSHQELSLAEGPYGWVVSSSATHLKQALMHHGLLECSVISLVREGAFLAPWVPLAPAIEAPIGETRDGIGWADWNDFELIAEENREIGECWYCTEVKECRYDFETDHLVCDDCRPFLDAPEPPEYCAYCGSEGARFVSFELDYVCEDCASHFGFREEFQNA